jgi:hypothetical protein
LQSMVEKLGNLAPDSTIFNDNPYHASNYGIVCKAMMDNDLSYVNFCNMHNVLFKLAKDVSEHKSKFEEVYNEAIYGITRSFFKANQKPQTPKATNPQVIKHHVKVKAVRKIEDYNMKLVSKKMMLEVIDYAKKFVKNKLLIAAGLASHIEVLPDLDILQ